MKKENKPLKAKEPVNNGSRDKGMCDAKPPIPDEFLTYPPEYSDRDWKEDFSHENGNYACKCSAGCSKMFYGHKRRVLCRTCAIPKPICGENCGCTGPEDCYGEAGLNLVEKIANENTSTIVDVVENKETVEQAAERHYPPYPMATILSGNISVNTQEVISNRNAFVKGANWQQSQSIGGIVGFVLEYVAKNAQASQNQNLSAYIDKDSILNMKSDIIKEYNNGK